MGKRTISENATLRIPVFRTGKERLAVWESAEETLKGRAPGMLKELGKMRKEWDRKLPQLS